MFRFLHDTSSAESIPVDQSLSNTNQSGHQLLLTSGCAETQNIPPLLVSDGQVRSENSLISSSVDEDYPALRPRTSAMLTSETHMRHCKSNNTQTVTPEHHDLNCGASKTVMDHESRSDNPPPPRPAKPAWLQHSSSKSSSHSSTKLSKSEIQSMACQACFEAMNDKLDIEKIVFCLKSCGLLNEKNLKYFTDPKHSKFDKIQYLFHKLPKSADNWFDKFVESLRQLPSSIQHRDIASLLLQKVKELEEKYRDSTVLGIPVPVSSYYEDLEVHIYIHSYIITTYIVSFIC